MPTNLLDLFQKLTLKWICQLSRFPLKPTLLQTFRWILPRAHREEIDLVIADIEQDIKDLRKQRHSHWFIRIVVLWHSLRTIQHTSLM